MENRVFPFEVCVDCPHGCQCGLALSDELCMPVTMQLQMAETVGKMNMSLHEVLIPYLLRS